MRFADLAALRLGSFPGYVYCHQGCCEHALFFRDVRIIHPDDSHDLADYPVPAYQASPPCSIGALRFLAC